MKSEQENMDSLLQSYKKSNEGLMIELAEIRRTENENKIEFSHQKKQAEREFEKLRSDSESSAENYKKEISELSEKLNDANALNSSLSETNKNLSGENEKLCKKNNFLNGLIDTLYEIGRFICSRLKLDFDRIVDKRLDGYSLKYIFGDNGRER